MAKSPDPFTPAGERHYFWKGVWDTIVYILAIVGGSILLIQVIQLGIPIARTYCGR